MKKKSVVAGADAGKSKAGGADRTERFNSIQKCPLTPEETLAYAKEMAELHGEMASIEKDAKSAAADFKARLAEKESRLSAISQRVQNGAEMRQVPCVRYFYGSVREVVEERADGGLPAVINRRTMTDPECQQELEL